MALLTRGEHLQTYERLGEMSAHLLSHSFILRPMSLSDRLVSPVTKNRSVGSVRRAYSLCLYSLEGLVLEDEYEDELGLFSMIEVVGYRLEATNPEGV